LENKISQYLKKEKRDKGKKKKKRFFSPSKCVYRQQNSLPRRIGLDPPQLKFVNSFAFAANAPKEKKERPIGSRDLPQRAVDAHRAKRKDRI